MGGRGTLGAVLWLHFSAVPRPGLQGLFIFWFYAWVPCFCSPSYILLLLAVGMTAACYEEAHIGACWGLLYGGARLKSSMLGG